MRGMTIKKIMFTEEELGGIVSELADKINSDLRGAESLTVLCVLKGAVMFTADLVRRLNVPDIRIEFIRASSYGKSDVSSGEVSVGDATGDIRGRDVLVIEDIIDTGRTLNSLKERLLKMQPKSLRFCGLFDKPSRRIADFKADYVGAVIPDEFIVGYGLDYAEYYRHLPYVAVIELSS